MRLIDANALKEYLEINDNDCEFCDYSDRKCSYTRYSNIDICSAISSIPKVGEWISVKEEKPEGFQDVLFAYRVSLGVSGSYTAIGIGFMQPDGTCILPGMQHRYEVFAWMPLPEMPEGETV